MCRLCALLAITTLESEIRWYQDVEYVVSNAEAVLSGREKKSQLCHAQVSAPFFPSLSLVSIQVRSAQVQYKPYLSGSNTSLICPGPIQALSLSFKVQYSSICQGPIQVNSVEAQYKPSPPSLSKSNSGPLCHSKLTDTDTVTLYPIILCACVEGGVFRSSRSARLVTTWPGGEIENTIKPYKV